MKRHSESARFATLFVLALGFCGALPATSSKAQEATIDAPSSVSPNAEFPVNWSGPDAPGDFIAISAPEGGAESFLSYARTSGGAPATLTAPAVGEYEIRYISAARLAVLAKQPLSVRIDADKAKLIAPGFAAPGELLRVSVEVAADASDYVTIVETGAPDDAFGPYARLRDQTAVEIEAPAAPGAYEIRLVQARDQTVLARAAIEIAEPASEPPAPGPATPERPAETRARPEPAQPAPDAKPGAPAQDAAPSEGIAPPETNIAGTDAESAAAQPPVRSEASPVEASLMALIAVDAGATFHVDWSGPGAPGDLVALAAPDSDDLLASAEAATGAPAVLTAPDQPGDYVLRYISAGGGAVLAERELEVR